VKLSDLDIAEFIKLCEQDGVKLTLDEARAIAVRLVLLYRHLARPTPTALAAGLAKRHRQSTVEGVPTSPAAPAATNQ
jgi:hypothetical protein